jgi:hypothetical protein
MFWSVTLVLLHHFCRKSQVQVNTHPWLSPVSPGTLDTAFLGVLSGLFRKKKGKTVPSWWLPSLKSNQLTSPQKIGALKVRLEVAHLTFGFYKVGSIGQQDLTFNTIPNESWGYKFHTIAFCSLHHERCFVHILRRHNQIRGLMGDK